MAAEDGELLKNEASPADEAKAIAIQDDDDDASDSLFGEFWLFLKEEKKWWLAPLVFVLLALGAIIVFAEGSAIAPFIYTIF